MPKRVSPNKLLRQVRKEFKALATDNVRLTEAYTRECELLKSNRQSLQDLRGELTRAKEMLQPLCGLVKPESLLMEYMDPVNRVHVDMPHPDQTGPISFDKLEQESYSVTRVPLDVLLTSVSIDRLRDVVHAQVSFKGHVVGYGISPSTLKYVPTRWLQRDVTEFVAKSLARQLMKELGR